jgi:hypothetical protein
MPFLFFFFFFLLPPCLLAFSPFRILTERRWCPQFVHFWCSGLKFKRTRTKIPHRAQERNVHACPSNWLEMCARSSSFYLSHSAQQYGADLWAGKLVGSAKHSLPLSRVKYERYKYTRTGKKHTPNGIISTVAFLCVCVFAKKAAGRNFFAYITNRKKRKERTGGGRRCKVELTK